MVVREKRYGVMETWENLLPRIGYMNEGKEIVIDPDYQRDYVYTETHIKEVMGPLFRDRYLSTITIMPYYTGKNYEKRIITVTNGRQRTETLYRISTDKIPIPTMIARKYLGVKTTRSIKYSQLPDYAKKIISQIEVLFEIREPAKEDLSIEERIEWNNHVRQIFTEMNRNLKKMMSAEVYATMYHNYGNVVKRLDTIAKEMEAIDWRPYRNVIHIDYVGYTKDPILGRGIRNPSWDGLSQISRSSTQFLKYVMIEREKFYTSEPLLAERHAEKLEATVKQVIKKYKILTNNQPLKKVLDFDPQARPTMLTTSLYIALIPYKPSYLQEALEAGNIRDKLFNKIQELYESNEKITVYRLKGKPTKMRIRDLFVSNAANSTRFRAATKLIIEQAFIPLLGDPIEENKEYIRKHREASKRKTNKNQHVHTWPPAASPAESREYYIIDNYNHTHALHGPRAMEIMEKLKNDNKIVKLDI